jgi:hypothetical protein
MNNIDTTKLYDKQFRNRLLSDPMKYAGELGYEAVEGVEFKVVKNTKNTIYISFGGVKFKNGSLTGIQAAGESSTAGSLGTATTAACFTSTLTSASSVGTAGTASHAS